MAEVKNVFIKGKMNQDLDERLVPKGEYREAQNITINESEDSDSGVVENILGNKQASNDTNTGSVGSDQKTIGYCNDIKNKRIFWFITNFDGDATVSNIRSMSLAQSSNVCKILMYDTISKQTKLLVEGHFLNFSKKHLITGVNIIDDLLYWTDDYNQPRKINVSRCENDSTYYQYEEQISVAKIAPYTQIRLIGVGGGSGLVTGVGELTSSITTPVASGATNGVYTGTVGTTTGFATNSVNGSGAILSITVASNSVTTSVGAVTVTNGGDGFKVGETITIDSSVIFGGGNADLVITLVAADILNDLSRDTTVESDYLQDNFVRFSYRYKFEDGEYSTIAPFTQIVFEPLNAGIISNTNDTRNTTGSVLNNTLEPDVPIDKEDIYKRTTVQIMQNAINKIVLRTPLPSLNEFQTSSTAWVNDLRITNIELLIKESDGVSVKLIKDIKVNTNTDFTGNISYHTIKPEDGGSAYKRWTYKYIYRSEKPYKVLPEDQLVRVYDQVPIRAKAQEMVANRLVYGNYTENYNYPTSENGGKGVNYTVGFDTKSEVERGDTFGMIQHFKDQYKYSSIKQRRTYQVGIVFSDRFGRQSPVLLSTNLDPAKPVKDTYTVPSKATQLQTLFNNGYSWSSQQKAYGISLDMTFEDNRLLNDADIFSNTVTNNQSDYNPFGWYSWKVVVKQTEQEYYNIYVSHPADSWNNVDNRHDTTQSGRSWISLYGDNINKIPRSIKDYDINRPGIAGCDVKLYPKVVYGGTAVATGEVNSNSEIQANNTTGLIDVISLGTAREQNLFMAGAIGDRAGQGGYSVLGFVYGKDKSPLMAELPNLKKEINVDNQAGVLGIIKDDTSVSTAAVITSDIEDIIGTNNANSLDGYIVTGANIHSVVTVNGDPSKTTVSSAADPQNGTGTLNVVWGIQQTLKARDQMLFTNVKEGLTVFETEPFESKIDIYYETVTCGLIKDLNDQVIDTAGSVPSNLRITPPDGSPSVSANWPEATASGETIGTLTATAANNGTITFDKISFKDGNTLLVDSKVLVDSATGVVTSSGVFAFNNTVRDAHVLEVRYTENNQAQNTETVTINITNSVPTMYSLPVDGDSIQSSSVNSPLEIDLITTAPSGTEVFTFTVTNGAALTSENTASLVSEINFSNNTAFNDYFELSLVGDEVAIKTTTSFDGSIFFAASNAARSFIVTVKDLYTGQGQVADGSLTVTGWVRIDGQTPRISGLLAFDAGDNLDLICCTGNYQTYYIAEGSAGSVIKIGDYINLQVGNYIYTEDAPGNLNAPNGYYVFLDGNNDTHYGTLSNGIVTAVSSCTCEQ